MKFLEVIIELFGLYILYKLVFDFIIPVANTTKQVKKQFGDMQEKMRQFQQDQQKQPSSTATPQPNIPEKGDYIDFEEVK